MISKIAAVCAAVCLVGGILTVEALAHGATRVVSGTGSGNTRTLASADAKDKAVGLRMIGENLVSYGACQCDNSNAGTSYPAHWICTVDATVEKQRS